MGTLEPIYEGTERAGTTRRHFYVGAIYAMWAVISTALSFPAVAYLFLSPKTRRRESWVDIADIGALETNLPTLKMFHRTRTDGWRATSERLTAWVLKTNEGDVVAFGPQCTHLGCAYRWEQDRNQFVCPCHQSLFSIDGRPIAGPAPRPLDRYEIKVVNNRILLGGLHTSGFDKL